MPNFTEITCETACNKIKSGRMPYSWDLNIYRGCEHGCIYCFAMYSHDYLGDSKFFDHIFVKTNIVEKFEKLLASPSWKRQVVNIGGVTDSYQSGEKTYKFMPQILELLIKYKTPCIISTKSDLILRDYDLIDKLSQITYVNIAATITATDEDIRKKIEPYGVTSAKRFEVLKTFSGTNASTGLHFMPIIPYITDTYENIDTLFSMGKDSKISYVLPGVLYLRGKTRFQFFESVKKDFPRLYEPLQNLYKTGGAHKEYKDNLYKTVNMLKNKYSLSSQYSKIMKEKLDKSNNEMQQISLFDI